MTTKNVKSIEKEKKCDFNEIKVGTRLSETQYYDVIQIDRNINPRPGHPSGVKVRNERGFEFYIASAIVEEGMFSDAQYTETVSVTRTELVEELEKAGETIFTVNFNKQADPKMVAENIQRLTNGKTTSKITQKLLKEAMMGEERTLIGYLISIEQKMGRSMVVDLEARSEGKNAVRLVDHRTLNWMILRNKKYIVKD